MMKVSVLILTFNEAANLPACLDALSWCDDILVLDSGSSDESVGLAQSRGARVLFRPFDDFARQRNFGLENGNFRHDWVLHLDADEVVTPELAAALETLEARPEIDAYRLPSRLMLYGCWLRYAGMYPTYQVRLGRRDVLRFNQIGHGQREDLAPDRVSLLDEPYLHYSFARGMKAWLQRHIQYANDEADFILAQRAASAASASPALPSAVRAEDATARRRAAKAWAVRLPLWSRPILRFFYVYFFRMGLRDGRAGFSYAIMLAVYEGMTTVLAYEKLHQETRKLTDQSSARVDVM